LRSSRPGHAAADLVVAGGHGAAARLRSLAGLAGPGDRCGALAAKRLELAPPPPGPAHGFAGSVRPVLTQSGFPSLSA